MAEIHEHKDHIPEGAMEVATGKEESKFSEEDLRSTIELLTGIGNHEKRGVAILFEVSRDEEFVSISGRVKISRVSRMEVIEAVVQAINLKPAEYAAYLLMNEELSGDESK